MHATTYLVLAGKLTVCNAYLTYIFRSILNSISQSLYVIILLHLAISQTVEMSLCIKILNITRAHARDVNKNFSFETETLESLFETRPRPFETQTEMLFEMSQTVQPVKLLPSNCYKLCITSVMKIISKQCKSMEIRSDENNQMESGN